MNYKEFHTFPNGLYIDYYSNLDIDYKADRDNVKTNEDLKSLKDKWKYLFPEINEDLTNNLIILQSLIVSHELQDNYLNRIIFNSDNIAKAYFNLLLPYSFAKPLCIAKEYGVCVGTVYIQMWNAGKIDELPDGTWRIK